MTALQVVRESLKLLAPRDRLILGLITIAQMATAFLDLAGVLMIGIVGVLAATAVSGETMPASVQSIVDTFGWQDVDSLTLTAWLIALAGIALVLKTVLSALLGRATFRFLAKRQADTSARLTAGLLARPLLDIQQWASQDLAYALTVGCQQATVGVLGSASAALADLALLVVLGVGLATVDLSVSLFALLFFGALTLVLQRTLSGWSTRLGREATAIDIESYVAIQEALGSYREMLVSDRRGLYVHRIQGIRKRSADVAADAQFMTLIPKYVFEVGLVVGGLALAVSQAMTKDVAAAVGIVAVFLVAGSRIMPALLRMQVTSLTLRRSEAAASTVYSLARRITPVAPSEPRSLDPVLIRQSLEAGHLDFRPSVVLEDVWLTYPGEPLPAVEGVSFRVAEGTSVALVGPTGAGKSTLADVLLGVVEPQRGTIRVGGLTPLDAISRWPGGVAYVPQEVSLANGTVRDNVALGLPREAIDDDWVWRALERAHLADFLREGRQGLETLVGENGMRLSGGQRQRLGVARALYTQPRLLVLDEATSALDAETEQAIAQMLQELEGEVTTVTIAHRLATIRHCDLVLYLEGGVVVAKGSFDEVRSKADAFDQQARLLGL